MSKQISILIFLIIFGLSVIGCGGGGGGSSVASDYSNLPGAHDGITFKDSQNISTLGSLVGASAILLEYTDIMPSSSKPYLSAPIFIPLSTVYTSYAGHRITFSIENNFYSNNSIFIGHNQSISQITSYKSQILGNWNGFDLTVNHNVSNIKTKNFDPILHKWSFEGNYDFTGSCTKENCVISEITQASAEVNVTMSQGIPTFKLNYTKLNGTTKISCSDGWSIDAIFDVNNFNGEVKYNGVTQGTLYANKTTVTAIDYETNDKITINY